MIFPSTDTPRIIGVPPGADFSQTLHDNLLRLTESHPPQALARVDILVPTERMKRRLHQLFTKGGPRLLPRIGTITNTSHLLPGAISPSVSSLRRSLDLKSVVERLVALDPALPKASTIDLTESLTRLLDEMAGEGVPLASLDGISGGSTSGHWERSLAFLKTIRGYLDALTAEQASKEARHRETVQLLCAHWEETPRETPVIVAGSTGSRDTTRMLMQAVASLPQGVLVLPGFDHDLNDDVWSSLTKSREYEDHPQFRFARLLGDLGLEKSHVKSWGKESDSTRNKLISLALRPASYTDQWRLEGPKLGDLAVATRHMTLLQADQPRDEALSIAVAMRHAVGKGKRVALISPDATLARRVTVALERWGIRADDSAGTPLHLSPAGRFFRHVGALIEGDDASASVIALLKHPLTHHHERGPFQLFVQELELYLRKKALPTVTPAVLQMFATQKEAMQPIATWLSDRLQSASSPLPRTLAASVERHIMLAEALCADNALWEGSDGEKVQNVITSFQREAEFSERLIFSEYLQLFNRYLAAESDREQHGVRTDVTIWGTLEARVQGADLVILGGLNEGVWPEQPVPDPWLNRDMRAELGLLLPERQIGLAAHDFQQAAGAPEVILSRARRSEDSETVPSRWLNRLTNLLEGLPDTKGPEALEAMEQRGAVFVQAAQSLDVPDAQTTPAHRPAPAPPKTARPIEYSVTEIKTLIRDPYAIYAKHILKLEALDPLTPTPDARLKGIVFHDVLEEFYALDADFSDRDRAAKRLREITMRLLQAKVPWPATQLHWLGHLASIFDHLFDAEVARRSTTDQLAREVKGLYTVPSTPFRIKGKADRIDRAPEGLIIYDYKTGGPPSRKEIDFFDRQLPIEAVMAEAGAFRNVAPEAVAHVMHLGMGRNPSDQLTKLEGINKTVTVSADLAHLLMTFADPNTGYISRRAMEKVRYASDYDHLARFGEWDQSETATPETVE
ncbi:MAG: double-strand break repair protein AddB [Pseudomonadota bacterium]